MPTNYINLPSSSGYILTLNSNQTNYIPEAPSNHAIFYHDNSWWHLIKPTSGNTSGILWQKKDTESEWNPQSYSEFLDIGNNRECLVSNENDKLWVFDKVNLSVQHLNYIDSSWVIDSGVGSVSLPVGLISDLPRYSSVSITKNWNDEHLFYFAGDSNNLEYSYSADDGLNWSSKILIETWPGSNRNTFDSKHFSWDSGNGLENYIGVAYSSFATTGIRFSYLKEGDDYITGWNTEILPIVGDSDNFLTMRADHTHNHIYVSCGNVEVTGNSNYNPIVIYDRDPSGDWSIIFNQEVYDNNGDKKDRTILFVNDDQDKMFALLERSIFTQEQMIVLEYDITNTTTDFVSSGLSIDTQAQNYQTLIASTSYDNNNDTQGSIYIFRGEPPSESFSTFYNYLLPSSGTIHDSPQYFMNGFPL